MAEPTPLPSSPASEPMIDEMIDETFPASDPPQLMGSSGSTPRTRPASSAGGANESAARGKPATIGNQGSIPASGVLEESVPLGDGVVTLRFDGGHEHLHLYVGDGGLSMDAATLDRLISVLSTKRAAMTA